MTAVVYFLAGNYVLASVVFLARFWAVGKTIGRITPWERVAATVVAAVIWPAIAVFALFDIADESDGGAP